MPPLPNSSRWRSSVAARFLALLAGFFALYALTAQRGLSWGDSGEFQYRVLHLADGILGGCDSITTAHPLFVGLAKLVATTPFAVTLLSSFFGALAVAGLYLVTRRAALAVLFGLSHAVWWLSTLAEVQTMNVAFTAFETVVLLAVVRRASSPLYFLLLLLAGVHLYVHNFALLALPVYGLLGLGLCRRRRSAAPLLAGAAGWLLAAGPAVAAFVACACSQGLAVAFRTFLVGRWGGEVSGLLPPQPLVTAFNLALAALSFAAPALVAVAGRGRRGRPARRAGPTVCLWALFGINALFFARYFVVDQFTFALPTLFYAYVLLADVPLSRRFFAALAALQMALPLAAWAVLARLPPDAERAARHPGRDEAAYFAWPVKCFDGSADRAAARVRGPWKGEIPEDATPGGR